MYLFRSLLPLILTLFATLVTSTYVFQEVFEWSQVDFAYPDEKLKERAKATGAFIPKNALPVGVEHWRNKLFVTFPRWEDGMCGFAFINIENRLHYITITITHEYTVMLHFMQLGCHNKWNVVPLFLF